MILVDTSVWIDHFRVPNTMLIAELMAGKVLGHPFVLGELVVGNLHLRHPVVQVLRELPQVVVAENDEVLTFIDRHGLYRLGLSYVDVHLLASAQLTPDSRVWTRDRRFEEVARRMKLSA